MCRAPKVDATAPFTMLATILEANPYLGRLLTGRIQTRHGQGQYADQGA